MWLFTRFGFFSIVRKPDDSDLTIRSRTRGDLLRLIDSYLPEAGEPSERDGSDYPWRVRCSADELARAAAGIVADIDYPHFEAEVARSLGRPRAQRYGEIWKALYGMPEDLPEDAPQAWEGLPWPACAPVLQTSFGGVVVDPGGHLLLRTAAGPDGTQAWGFPQARLEPGETPRQAVLRAVLAQTGVRARILRPLTPAPATAAPAGTQAEPAGNPAQPAGSCHFFLLLAHPEQVDLGFRGAGTTAVRWASPVQARGLLSGGATSPVADAPDLAALDAALDALPPVPLQEPIARRNDWPLRPLPADRGTLAYQRQFTPAQMRRLLHGSIARRLDDAWCTVFQNSVLHLHRSWSGVEVFRLLLEPDPARPDHWRVRKAQVNRLYRPPGPDGDSGDHVLLDSALDAVLRSDGPPAHPRNADGGPP